MIRWYATTPDGRHTVGLGLEAGNIERLVDGRPILVRGETLGLPHDILIHYGATKLQMIEELREQGVDEKIIADAEDAYERKHGPIEE